MKQFDHMILGSCEGFACCAIRRQRSSTGTQKGKDSIKSQYTIWAYTWILLKNLETYLDVWCALEHPNITNFLGLSYDAPYPAAIILPYYSNGNSLDFIKREENPDILKLVHFDCASYCIFFNVYSQMSDPWCCRRTEISAWTVTFHNSCRHSSSMCTHFHSKTWHWSSPLV